MTTLGNELRANNLVVNYINGTPAASFGSGGGGGITLVDLAQNTAPTSSSTSSAATANSLTVAYTKAVSLIPGGASSTTAGTVKISDSYTLNDINTAASTAATYNLFDGVTNRTAHYATNVDPGSTVTIGVDSGFVDLRGGLKVKGAPPYSTYPPTSTDATAIPSASLVTQVYNGLQQATTSVLAGFDIIVAIGQSNGEGVGAYDANDATLDATDSDIYMMSGWANNPTDSTPITISLAQPSLWDMFTNSPTYNTGYPVTGHNQMAAFTFAKYYKKNFLQPGRKVLVIMAAWNGTSLVMNSTNTAYASTSDTNVIKVGSGGSYPSPIWGLTPWASWTAPTLCDANGSLYTVTKQAVRCALQMNISTTTVSGVGGLPTDTSAFGVSSSTGQAMNAQTPNKVVALIIQQGENEMTANNVTRAAYQTAHLALIDDFRTTFGATIPVLCGGFTDPLFNANANLMSVYGWTSTNYEKANDFQNNYWNSLNSSTGFLGVRSYTGYAIGTGLSYSPNTQSTKYIHYDSTGHRKMGVRLYKAYQYALTNIQNLPVSLIGIPTASVGSFNASNGTYPITITYNSTGSPTTATLYSGTNSSGTVLASGAATVVTGMVVNIAATSSGFTQNFFLFLSNPYNTSPATSTFSCVIPIPTPTVTITGASATATTLTIQGTSTNASSVVITNSATYGSGTTYGTITSAQFATGASLSVTFTVGNSYTIYAYAINTVPLNSTPATTSVTVINNNEYPPVALGFTTLNGSTTSGAGVSQTIVVSGQTYGNGTYVASASTCAGTSGTSGFCPNNAFDKLAGGSPAKSWASTDGGSYTATSGASPATYAHTPANSTTITTPSGTRNGEWLQIQLPTAITLTSYKLTKTTDFTGAQGAGNSPFEWYIVASNNGTTWTQIDTQTGINNWSTATDNSYNIITGTPTAYSYYRIIITKTMGGQSGATAYYGLIGDWALFGY